MKTSFNIINARHKRLFLVPLLLNLGILETKDKCTILLLTDLTWIFHYFCVRLYVLFSPIKKRVALFSEFFV